MQFNRSPFLLGVSIFVLIFSYLWLKPSKTWLEGESVREWLAGGRETTSEITSSAPKISVRAASIAPADQQAALAPSSNGEQQPSLDVAFLNPSDQPPATGVIPYAALSGVLSGQVNSPAWNAGSKSYTNEVFPVVRSGDKALRGAIYDPVFEEFAQTVMDGKTDMPTGVYVAGVLALPIVQQPADNAAFVSTEDGLITEFQSAARQGVTGLLAHNYLAGALFYNLQVGDEVRVVYGNGIVRYYRITEVSQFQRLDFSRLDGDFIDLATGERMNSTSVFARFYSGRDHVTFQTCLERDGRSNWGLIFVIAQPIW